MLDILETFGIQQAVSQATHQRGHILDCVRMLRFCLVKHGPIMLVFSAILMSLAQNSSLCSSLILSHLSLNHDGRWGPTDDFKTSFLHFPCSLLPSGTW